MELDDVRAFVAVADSGSVSQAALELHVTQSAVTRRLQRLETSLGAALLDRKTRPVVMTTAGQATLERCRRLLNDVREVRTAAANGTMPLGEVRIGVAHALTELTLTKPVGEVRRKFPKIALRLHTGWSRELLERVRSGALDAAIILLLDDQPLPPEVLSRRLGKDRLVVIARRRSGGLGRKALKDLAGVQWILNPEGCAARAALRKTLVHAGIDMVVAVETYNYDLQLALVSQNRGLGLTPERILLRSPLKSRLRILPIAGLDFPLTIWSVQRESFAGLEPIIAELGRVLGEKLGAGNQKLRNLAGAPAKS